MYRRILLAYDGTLEGRTALREGALLVRRTGAAAYLLSVVSVSPVVQMGEVFAANPLPADQAEQQRLFEEALDRLRGFGLTAEGRLVGGDPASEIIAYAKEVDADLVVVGHRKPTFIERWWSSQTGTYLVDHLSCSLLIARRLVSDEAFAAEMQRA